MREIKFRGKRIDNSEWVYGWLLTNKLGTYIITEENPIECTQYGYIEIDEYARVIPETVGQYTGLKDKNGKEIYEGDILHLWGGEYCQGYYEFNQKFIVKDLSDLFFLGECENIEILGNVYDSPELLEVL